ncbi:hypothetical protein GCM10027162_63540 [Streptomyces incanus]
MTEPPGFLRDRGDVVQGGPDGVRVRRQTARAALVVGEELVHEAGQPGDARVPQPFERDLDVGLLEGPVVLGPV